MRRNIIGIADEAHRSQYGFGGEVNAQTGAISYDFASNLRDALPNASFILLKGNPKSKDYEKKLDQFCKAAGLLDGADIVLFGRMAASLPSLTLEGAAMFSHALLRLRPGPESRQ